MNVAESDMGVLNGKVDFQSGVGQVQHLGTLLGERTTSDRTGDHMSERRDFDAGQRSLALVSGGSSGSLSPILTISISGV